MTNIQLGEKIFLMIDLSDDAVHLRDYVCHEHETKCPFKIKSTKLPNFSLGFKIANQFSHWLCQAGQGSKLFQISVSTNLAPYGYFGFRRFCFSPTEFCSCFSALVIKFHCRLRPLCWTDAISDLLKLSFPSPTTKMSILHSNFQC